MYNLVVRNPFGSYAKGAIITDQTTVRTILADPHRASCVVKTSVPADVIPANAEGGSPLSHLAPTQLAPRSTTVAGAAPAKPRALS